MATRTLRLNNELDTWLQRLAEGSGMSMNATIETLLDAAKRRGWTVEQRPGAVVEPT